MVTKEQNEQQVAIAYCPVAKDPANEDLWKVSVHVCVNGVKLPWSSQWGYLNDNGWREGLPAKFEEVKSKDPCVLDKIYNDGRYVGLTGGAYIGDCYIA